MENEGFVFTADVGNYAPSNVVEEIFSIDAYIPVIEEFVFEHPEIQESQEVSAGEVAPGQLFYFGGDESTLAEYWADPMTAEITGRLLREGNDVTVYFG